MTEHNVVRLVVPLEITVRIDCPGSGEIVALTAIVGTDASRALTKPAGATRVDVAYTNREGCGPDTVPGVEVTLPEENQKLRMQISPLRAGEYHP